MSFSHNALSLLKIDSFKTGMLSTGSTFGLKHANLHRSHLLGTILLSGLFFYDIWWVFGTEVVSPHNEQSP